MGVRESLTKRVLLGESQCLRAVAQGIDEQ
jgi:hypothetical protein